MKPDLFLEEARLGPRNLVLVEPDEAPRLAHLRRYFQDYVRVDDACHVLLCRGDFHDAVRRLEAVARGLPGRRACPPGRSPRRACSATRARWLGIRRSARAVWPANVVSEAPRRALYLLGEIARGAGDARVSSGGKNHLSAMALASELGLCPLVAHCHLGLGRLYGRTGGGPKAREHLTIASTMYREMDMGSGLEKAEAVQSDAIPPWMRAIHGRGAWVDPWTRLRPPLLMMQSDR
jgi:hypothetical protein